MGYPGMLKGNHATFRVIEDAHVVVVVIEVVNVCVGVELDVVVVVNVRVTVVVDTVVVRVVELEEVVTVVERVDVLVTVVRVVDVVDRPVLVNVTVLCTAFVVARFVVELTMDQYSQRGVTTPVGHVMPWLGWRIQSCPPFNKHTCGSV